MNVFLQKCLLSVIPIAWERVALLNSFLMTRLDSLHALRRHYPEHSKSLQVFAHLHIFQVSSK